MATALRIEPITALTASPIVLPAKRRPRRAKPAAQALRDALAKPRICTDLRCNCAECIRIQESTTISCKTCGHSGRAATWYCSCDKGRRELVERLAIVRAEITSGDLREWIDYSNMPIARVERELAAAIADAKAMKGCLCRAGTKEGVDCLHGQAFCAVCFGADQTGNAEEAWEMARDVSAASSQLLSQVMAILQRPNTEFYGASPVVCSCEQCEALRAAGMRCRLCGFQGAPFVYPCECRELRASNIACGREGIAAINAGGEGDLAYHERMLKEALLLPDCDCRHGRASLCGHGNDDCPCCGDDGNAFQHGWGGEYALAVLTDLRALLADKPQPMRLTRTGSAKTVA